MKLTKEEMIYFGFGIALVAGALGALAFALSRPAAPELAPRVTASNVRKDLSYDLSVEEDT
jgi:hypothetical protein